MDTTDAPASRPEKRARRHYSPQLKAELVAKAGGPGVSVSAVAREHGVNANQLFKWIRIARLDGERRAARKREQGTTLVPVTLTAQNPSSPTPSASSTSGAALEVALPQATLRFGEGWEPARVAALMRLLGA